MNLDDIPEPLAKLGQRSPHSAAMLGLMNAVSTILADNVMPFFPAYTDHGTRHIRRILLASTNLVPDDVVRGGLLLPDDACVLICASLLHDIAMHLREASFLALVSPESSRNPLPWFDQPYSGRSPDLPWPELWQSFRRDARHFTGSQLDRLLGPAHAGVPAVAFGDVDRNPHDWQLPDRLLIGEFLRRHHARIAHEVAMYGFPGTMGDTFPVLHRTMGELGDAIGVAARSHNERLRTIVDYCEYSQPGNQRPWGTVLPFLMALLRVADYLDLEADRAPPLLLT